MREVKETNDVCRFTYCIFSRREEKGKGKIENACITRRGEA
jgi:hypothetical protein